MTCQYHGCNNEADFVTQQRIGKKQKLHMCQHCAPEWVKNGDVIKTLPSGHRVQIYDVTPIGTFT